MADVVSNQADFPEAFQPLFGKYRYKIYYGGRGGGKTQNFARALLIQSCQRPLRVLCARELQNSIRESVHKELAGQIEALGMNYRFQVQQASIKSDLGGEFFFEGLKLNADKVRSYANVDVAWVEEAHSTSKDSWDTLIPTIRKAGSEIWAGFNPNLETDDTYRRFVKTDITGLPYDKSQYDGWAVVRKVNWRDNPWFPQPLMYEMEAMKASNYDEYLHIWEGHCKQMLEGAVYAEELRAALAQQRLTRLHYDKTLPVFTFWDLGWADMTCIWFVQLVGTEVHIIDYYQNRLKDTDHYLQMLQARGYIYDTHWLPHDAKAKEKGTGRSIEELIKAKGFKVRIVPKLSKADGINMARLIFAKCYFDADRCEEGVQALRHYRYEIVDNVRGSLSKEPVHDWASHAADAFRYLAVGLRQPKEHVNTNIEMPHRAGTLGALLRPRIAANGWMGR